MNTSPNSPPPTSFPMFWKLMVATTFLIASVALAWTALAHFAKPKIGYVRNVDLLRSFKGMQDGKKQFDQKVSAWNANLDSLTSRFTAEMKAFEAEAPLLPEGERKAKEELLEMKRQQAIEYQGVVEGMAADAEKEMMAGILKQVDAYLLAYGKANGYDYIFGITAEGNILYAKEGDDITEAVSEAINKQYEGE